MVILEVCVDTIEGALAAVTGGANRIELCAALSEGGLTPSAGLMQAAVKLPVPCYAMIRPRCGRFQFSDAEVDIMLTDIAVARDAGLHGVVLGAQNGEGALDVTLLKRLVKAAGPMGKTLHRVIDVVPDPIEALNQAINLGFERVLTSGAKPSAAQGVALIHQMIAAADDQIIIMLGAGLNADNVGVVVQTTGATEVHASCRVASASTILSGFAPPNGQNITSSAEVRRMVTALRG